MLWLTLLVVDPSLITSREVALYEIAPHALFGLGTLVCRRPGTATIIVP